MRLTKLILEQFRNYRHLELDFNPDEPMTYIVGPNAQGKTNILESIYLLALTKSFRTSKQQDMIGWEHEYARVKGIFEVEDAANQTGSINSTAPGRPDSQHSLELEAFLGKPPNPQKAFKKNNVKISTTNFIGNCQVVFFHPEDLNMLYLGPDLRRAYLNVMNVQVNRKYFSALRSYTQVLKQRNALLRAIKEQRAHEADLDVWDEQLVEHGSYLMLERMKTIEYFQQHLATTYQKISQGQEEVDIVYRHTLESLNNTVQTPSFAPTLDEQAQESATISLKSLQFDFTRELLRTRPRDLHALVTTIGPHRDDLEFTFSGLKLAAHASRGEYRSLLLALKLIELNFFEKRTAQKPLLLLDDVFSELDPKRQNLLLQAIEGHQTIITTTHLSDESAARQHRNLTTTRAGKYLEVSQGTIHEPATT